MIHCDNSTCEDVWVQLEFCFGSWAPDNSNPLKKVSQIRVPSSPNSHTWFPPRWVFCLWTQREAFRSQVKCRHRYSMTRGKDILSFIFSSLCCTSSSTNTSVIFFPFCSSCTATTDPTKAQVGAVVCSPLYRCHSVKAALLVFLHTSAFFSLCKSWSKHHSHMEGEKKSQRGLSFLNVAIKWVPLLWQNGCFRKPPNDLYLLEFVMVGLFAVRRTQGSKLSKPAQYTSLQSFLHKICSILWKCPRWNSRCTVRTAPTGV